MAYHGVLIPEAIAATNIDSLNRSVISACAIDNGYVFQVTTKVETSGSGAEVFNTLVPATGSLVGLWMAYSGDEIVVTDARYKGIDPDPRNFYNAAGKVFSAYKPQVGDIILLTEDAMQTVYSASALYAVAADGSMKMAWGATFTEPKVQLTYKLLGVKYISLATGAIDTQRVASYELECIGGI